MDLDLTDRTAVVTGGASGIGRATALALAESGADVAVGDLRERPRDDGEADPTADRVGDLGRKGVFVRTDVSDEDDVAHLVDRAATELGGVDILVTSAGSPQHPGAVADLPRADWETVLSVNLTGVYLCAKHAVPHLSESPAARIITVASTFGMVGYPNRAAYCASKAGVINLTRELALDYAHVPILANAVCPGFVRTGRTRQTLEDDEARSRIEAATPLPYFGQPDDIAAMATFLASDASRYLTGQAIAVDGGFTAV